MKALEQARAQKTHQLEIRIHDLDDKLLALQQEQKPLNDLVYRATTANINAATAYKNYAASGKNCPTCLRPMGTVDPKRLQQLEEARATTQDMLDKRTDAVTANQTKIAQLQQERRHLTTEMRQIGATDELTEITEQSEELDSAVEAASATLADLKTELALHEKGPSDSDLRTAEARVADRLETYQKAQQDAQLAKEALAQEKETCQTLEYWTGAFSPYGIPNMVLRDAIAPLNKEARRISAAMTGGTIEVRYSTVKELAKGVEKAQLNVEIDNKLGDRELAGSSKGEAGLTNFIIAETLSEVGQVSRRIGYRWYDEIVPHQDPKVCNSIYEYMKDVANRLGILVFLVDHNPVAANYADHILLVEKQLKDRQVVSSARWR